MSKPIIKSNESLELTGIQDSIISRNKRAPILPILTTSSSKCEILDETERNIKPIL